MPIYEFICDECGQTFEELLRSTEEIRSVVCPNCASEHVKKKISTFASKVSGGSSFSFDSSAASACRTGST